MDNMEKINAKHWERKSRFLRRFPMATPAQYQCLNTQHFARRYARGKVKFD